MTGCRRHDVVVARTPNTNASSLDVTTSCALCYRHRHLDERATHVHSTPNVITLIGARSEPRGRRRNDGRTRPQHPLGQQVARKVRAWRTRPPSSTIRRRNSAEAGSQPRWWLVAEVCLWVMQWDFDADAVVGLSAAAACASASRWCGGRTARSW